VNRRRPPTGWAGAASRPLLGLRVVVTRRREQAGPLAARLQALGAEVLALPAIVITPPADGGRALRAAVARVGDYDWVVCTSANAARSFCAVLGRPVGLDDVRLAAIGPGTAEALAVHGLHVHLVAARSVAEALLAAFPPPSSRGRGRVLLPRAAVARDVLPEGLRARGWQVDVVQAYRTTSARPPWDAIAAARGAHAITFTSASTVTNCVELLGREAIPPLLVCIGPLTAEAARRHGLTVTAVAAVHTINGLIEALVTAWPSAASHQTRSTTHRGAKR
jgi:uroporphyrinogen III methyltransferase / synthase